MSDAALLGTWIRRFLADYLVSRMQPCAKHAAELPGHSDPGYPRSPPYRLRRKSTKSPCSIFPPEVVRHFPTAPGGVPEMRNSHPEPAAGCNPLTGSLRRAA